MKDLRKKFDEFLHTMGIKADFYARFQHRDDSYFEKTDPSQWVLMAFNWKVHKQPGLTEEKQWEAVHNGWREKLKEK